ncbi:TPA: hypothetical protein ACMDO7_003566 [Vibrio cholerae]|uniref:chromosome partitioning protein ParA n=1 Tax=Shewanella xiamenensis TaxID=332186 RepID=UPI001F05821C|nr:chromosome partitioning protein ParA [Shewanella xiamenensis]UML92222.1 chromosome partitioning protein ParA [Shewanella xiamenensis]
MLTEILNVVESVPNVVWSGIVASCLTLFGVFLTNKGNAQRQRDLLEHEKIKYKSEQQLSLKKEVYLNLADSFASALGVIPKLINLDLSKQEIEKILKNHSGSVAKSYLVAKESTVSEILDFSAETAEALLPLFKQRAILLDHKKAIEIYQSTIDAANEEKNRILSIFKELNFQNNKDSSLYDYLNGSYELNDKISRENSELKSEQELILRKLHIEFTRTCLQEHSRLLSSLPKMTIALREELESDENPAIFIAALNRNIERMSGAYDKLLDEPQT